MKKINSILVAMFAFVMFSCSSAPSVGEGEFVISGRLTNVPDSVELQLMIREGKMLKTIATDTVINGEFMFRDTITSGVRRLLLMSNDEPGFPGTWLDVWVAPNSLTEIVGEDKLLKTWRIESDVQEQKDENDFANATLPEQKKLMVLLVQEYDLLRLYFKSERDKIKDKECWGKIDSLRKLEYPLINIISNKQLEHLKTASVSNHWMCSYSDLARTLTYEKDSLRITKIKELYGRLSDSDKQTDTGQQIYDYLNPPLKVNIGDDMADGDLYDLAGKLQHLAQFKGKYILLDFWSQGCGPCIQSIPELDEVAEIYKDELVVVGISSDNKEMWMKYVTDKKLKGVQWNELRAVPRLAASYGVVGIPHYVLISPEAKVQSTWTGYGKGGLKAKLKEEIE